MDTRALIEKYNIRANKSLGQNFLHREDIIKLIADSAADAQNALEIGAGLGVVTKELCSRFEKVATIEIDRALKAVTDEVLANAGNHKMVYADFVRFKLSELDDYFGEGTLNVVGNLPYNITGEIITKLIKNRHRFKAAVVMVQKEAAQKLSAPPKSKQYRAISVLTQVYADITEITDVSADCFIPAPHVTSSVIRLDLKDQTLIPRDKEADFNMFIHRVFNQRRKFLTAIFQNSDEREKARGILKRLGFTDKTRGEEMDPDSLCRFYLQMYCE